MHEGGSGGVVNPSGARGCNEEEEAEEDRFCPSSHAVDPHVQMVSPTQGQLSSSVENVPDRRICGVRDAWPTGT
jgi:hypothetical protein